MMAVAIKPSDASVLIVLSLTSPRTRRPKAPQHSRLMGTHEPSTKGPSPVWDGAESTIQGLRRIGHFSGENVRLTDEFEAPSSALSRRRPVSWTTGHHHRGASDQPTEARECSPIRSLEFQTRSPFGE